MKSHKITQNECGYYTIETFGCNNRDDLLKYLYDNLYSEIASVNEHECIKYHQHSDGIYVVTNLYGFETIKLADYKGQPIHFSDALKTEKEFNESSYCRKINLINEEKMSYAHFSQLIKLLEDILGDYGHDILTINSENWSVCCRIEKPI